MVALDAFHITNASGCPATLVWGDLSQIINGWCMWVVTVNFLHKTPETVTYQYNDSGEITALAVWTVQRL